MEVILAISNKQDELIDAVNSNTERVDKIFDWIEDMEPDIESNGKRVEALENEGKPEYGIYVPEQPEQQGVYLCAQCDRPIPDCTCGAWYQPVKVEHREPAPGNEIGDCDSCKHLYKDCSSCDYEPAPEQPEQQGGYWWCPGCRTVRTSAGVRERETGGMECTGCAGDVVWRDKSEIMQSNTANPHRRAL
jgi:hypothetical protein